MERQEYEVRSGGRLIESGFRNEREATEWASDYLGSLGNEAIDLPPFTIEAVNG